MNGVGEARREIAVEGALGLSGPEARLSVTGAGRTVVVHSDDSRSLRRLLVSVPGNRRLRGSAKRLHAALRKCGITLDVRLGSGSIARLGIEARPTWAARLVGVPSAQLGWRGLGLCLRAAALDRKRRRA